MDCICNGNSYVFNKEFFEFIIFEMWANKDEVLASNYCACFACGKYLFPEEIKSFDEDDSAICPYCNTDAIVPDTSNFPLDSEFILSVHKRICQMG